jgi:hypothetical protein
MIRPGAAAVLARWRDVLIGAALGALGLWLLPTPGYVVPALGAGLTALGAGLMLVALRRLRLSAASQGPGVVQVIEGQLAYFGPEGGGFLSLDDLAALAVEGDAWVLTGTDGTRVRVPRGAQGVEALTDALVRLPGLDPGALVRAASVGPDLALWRRGAAGGVPLTWAGGRDRSGDT